MIVAPPFDDGALNATLALVLPAVTVPMTGAPGTVLGVTVTEPDAVPLPSAFVALTVQVYCVPLVMPVTRIGLVVPVPVSVVDDAVHEAV